MVFFVVEASIHDDQLDAFWPVAKAFRDAGRADPGNVQFLINADPLEPGGVLFFTEWRSMADFDAHIDAAHTRAFMTAMAAFGSAPPVMRLIEPEHVFER